MTVPLDIGHRLLVLAFQIKFLGIPLRIQIRPFLAIIGQHLHLRRIPVLQLFLRFVDLDHFASRPADTGIDTLELRGIPEGPIDGASGLLAPLPFRQIRHGLDDLQALLQLIG
ncbi:hypothetical protein D9M73_296450 [compost metagenome]